MYHVCSRCQAPCAVLKCPCLLPTYYCNAACQKAHSVRHHLDCSICILGKLDKHQARLDALMATGIAAEPCAVLKVEQALAMLHCSIGRTMGLSQQPKIYTKAATHCRRALFLHRKVRSFCETATGTTLVRAKRIMLQKTAVHGLYDTLQNMGDVCRLGQKYPEAFEALSTALSDVRGEIEVCTSPILQKRLAFILGSIANVHVHVHHDHMHHDGRAIDNSNCYAAIKLLQEAIMLWRMLAREEQLAQALLYLATAYNDLAHFVQADAVLQEALGLAHNCSHHGKMHTAACHQQIAFNSLGQAMHLRTELYVHKMFLLTNSMAYYHQRRNTVRVAGLASKVEYNGLEAVVLEVGAVRITVRLLAGCYENKVLNIKHENAQPLIHTAAELQAKFERIQKLTTMQIHSSTRSYEIQLDMTGARHINTAITCYTLATAYSKTYCQKDMRKALELITKANRIRVRIGDTHAERSDVFPELTKELQGALVDFDKPGFLSSVPCCWPATSRRQDKKDMRQLFVALQARSPNRTVSSEGMLEYLRLYGIFDVTAVATNTVDCAFFTATACNELQNMKLRAITGASPTSAHA